jgi:threonine/homoserine/homoserine lactone efflux protein
MCRGSEVAILSCMIISINIVWLSLGATMARLLASPRTGRALNIGFAVLLVASVTATLLF